MLAATQLMVVLQELTDKAWEKKSAEWQPSCPRYLNGPVINSNCCRKTEVQTIYLKNLRLPPFVIS